MTLRNKHGMVGILIVMLALAAPPARAQDKVSVYPLGSSFPLQLYALAPDSHIPLVAPNGWNVGHRYGWAQGGDLDRLNALLQTFARNGLDGLPALPARGIIDDTGRTGWEETDIDNWIQALAPNANIAYWDLPEELRYWKPNEWAIVQNYTAWTRAQDPQLRPNYMYIPTHYTAEQVHNYVPYLDIVPASAYADHMGWPHAWVRWRMEETIRGISLADRIIGSDYLNGQKTPVGIVQLFAFPGEIVPTPEQTYHDFWQLIASGAQGIFVFSYARGQTDAGGALIANWNLLQQAASQITGPEQLGDMVLFGTAVSGVTSSVLDGPDQTVAFIPTGYTEPVQFPSIHLYTQQWNGNTYIIAINSTDQDVLARIANLPTSSTSATVLFQSRTVPIDDGSFSDAFSPWGVNIYRMENVGAGLPRPDAALQSSER
jgi:hypothetical protein